MSKTQPSPQRRKLRLLRDEPAGDLLLVIRAAPATLDETIASIVEDVLDSAEMYVVERPGAGRILLHGVSAFARRPGTTPGEVLRRFSASPRYLEVAVGTLRAAGFDVLATGASSDHYDILLVDGYTEETGGASPVEVEAAARRLIGIAGDFRPNPSYAGRADPFEERR